MLTRVEHSPGGVALVVPEALAASAGLEAGGVAEVELTAGRLVVRTAGPPAAGPATLAEMLAAITPENRHSEWAAGPPAGRELL